jgi:RHS repeat-associated protein
VRISFTGNGAGGRQLKDNNDYYPFGMNHLKTGNAYFGAGSYVKYKYNEKELQETGMYDYGARMYMADLGRWTGIDPYAERYIKTSPYHYGFNNPVFFGDPDGKKIIIYYQVGDKKLSYEYIYSKDRKLTGNAFLDNTIAALDDMYQNSALDLDTDGDGKKDKNYMEELIGSSRTLGITEGSETKFLRGLSYNEQSGKWGYDPSNLGIGKLYFNFNNGFLFNNSEFTAENRDALKERYEKGKLDANDKISSPIMGLGHEMIHAGNFILDNAAYFERTDPKNKFEKPDKFGFPNNEEIRTTKLSQQVSDALNEPQRKVYWGISLPTSSTINQKKQK